MWDEYKDRKCETIFISVEIEKNHCFHLWLDESRWVANVYEVVTIYCKGILFFRWNKIINEETRKKKDHEVFRILDWSIVSQDLNIKIKEG